MNDCSNADMRDRLPDLLHDRLEAPVRAEVLAHVNACADCTAELALLRDVRAVLTREARQPAVSVDRIVRALPSPAAVRSARVRARGGARWVNWRVAASIAALAVGGASVGTYLRMGAGEPGMAAAGSPAMSAAAMPPAAPATAEIASQGAGASATSGASLATVTELATGEQLNDMSAAQLEALLADIQRIQPVPPAEPDTTIAAAVSAGGAGSF